ncbi:MAG TPA: hypothetical protein VFV38_33175, partial [Ktedonobacteraceae bacterium]|nr:hypothetical protein [Ktedonobacteraceae bacterium]
MKGEESETAPPPPGTPARLRISGQICEGREARLEKRDVRVTVIRGGSSINGYYYSQEALQAIAGLMENAQAYVDHVSSPASGSTRSVRDIVG